MLRILKRVKTFGLILQLFLLMGCSSTKESLSVETWSRMENVVASRNFQFVARWAELLQTGGMARAANPGFLVMQGDTVRMDLAYYGTQHVVQNYAGAQGMQFEGTVTNIKTNKNESKNYYDLDFHLKQKTEILQCKLRVFPGLRGLLTIYSNKRDMIRYDGKVQLVKDAAIP